MKLKSGRGHRRKSWIYRYLAYLEDGSKFVKVWEQRNLKWFWKERKKERVYEGESGGLQKQKGRGFLVMTKGTRISHNSKAVSAVVYGDLWN